MAPAPHHRKPKAEFPPNPECAPDPPPSPTPPLDAHARLKETDRTIPDSALRISKTCFALYASAPAAKPASSPHFPCWQSAPLPHKAPPGKTAPPPPPP